MIMGMERPIRYKNRANHNHKAEQVDQMGIKTQKILGTVIRTTAIPVIRTILVTRNQEQPGTKNLQKT
jgi:hypothetical protein